MQVADDTLKQDIIREWQESFKTSAFQHAVCACCARSVPEAQCAQVHPTAIDLTLLRNDLLPVKVRPSDYAFELYQRALLCLHGMSDRWTLSDINLCRTCHRELATRGKMPKLSLANWLYYGIDALPASVSAAFKASSPFDRILVSRARGSRISYRFTELRKNKSFQPEPGRFADAATAQRFVKGNILIMPQNSTTLNTVLPPPPAVIRDTVCALFIGKSKPTKDTIGKISPVLVRKSTVSTIIQFLVAENDHYACDTSFHGYSRENLDMLLDDDSSNDVGVPCAMDIGFLQDSEVIRSTSSDYTHRDEDADVPPPGTELLMENVGYTCGDDTPVSYRNMKFRALNHCLTGGRFVQSQAGERFIPDFENPSLMTWMFPHLDPWGIGGFHHPQRTRPLTLEEQLRYLLELHDSPFAKDADFAFVYYNILQKKAVCDSVMFRVKASQQREIIQQLLAIDKNVLSSLMEKYKRNPGYETDIREELSLLSLVNKVSTVLHDLPGTSGYKIRLRNEIRALVAQKGTPAFFITLNPSDVQNPLVRLFAGRHVDLEHMMAGEEFTEWDRKLLVARNPAACAKFFHTMITSFVSIILRYGREDVGLFG
ncbi:hypothetical protein C8Q76DRAFT_566412, partial [Earliella scabrosa]